MSSVPTERCIAALETAIGADRITVDADRLASFATDESGLPPVAPAAVVSPREPGEIREVMRVANDTRVPVTARGAGTGHTSANFGNMVCVYIYIYIYIIPAFAEHSEG